MKRVFAILLLIAGLLISGSALSNDKKMATADLELIDHLPQDPILISVIAVEDLGTKFDEMLNFIEEFDESLAREKVDAKLAEFDEKLGCSLRNDLLGQIGPEFGMVLDLPPIDQLMASFANLDTAIPLALEKVGLLGMVRDEEKINSCLRRLFALAEAESVDEEGLIRVRLPDSESTNIDFYFAIKEGVLAMGSSPEFVRASLSPRVEGERLVDGSDFAQVFSHLDQAPQTLMYLNLPKIRSMVEASTFVQNMLNGKPEARQMADLFLNAEFTSMGFGSSSIETGGGKRTTSFGPAALSGGAASAGIIAAIAIPNLLNAIDRGKQKRTMADLRSVGTAFESYAIDNNRYPGPTDGWVTGEEVESSVEPIYIRTMPKEDGWGNPLLFLSDGESYVIVSPGKDGILDRDWSDGTGPGASTSFNDDIVFTHGQFVAWPEGTQQ